MSDDHKEQKPPYAPFGTFKNFLNEIGVGLLPNVIDKSLMPKMSGGMQSVLIAALRSTGMIGSNGVPTDRLTDYVHGDEDAKRAAIKAAVHQGFPFFFDENVDLNRITPQTFDDILRDQGHVRGSTLDKSASFFLGAAEYSKIPLSVHLKNRKPTRTKAPRTKRESNGPDEDNGKNQTDRRVSDQNPTEERPLEYRLIDLMGEADVDDDVRDAIWILVRYLKERELN